VKTKLQLETSRKSTHTGRNCSIGLEVFNYIKHMPMLGLGSVSHCRYA